MELLTGSIPTETQTAGKGLLLRHRALFRGHLLRQAGCLLPAVGSYGFFNAAVDLLLRALGSAHKPIEPRHGQPETEQPNPAGANLDTHQWNARSRRCRTVRPGTL
jgi:hypothetical protein